MPRGISESTAASSEFDGVGERTLIIGAEEPIRVSAAHRLQGHEGNCSRPHGHNFQITVEIRGTLNEEGWIVDKAAITDVVERWDHRFIVERGDPLIDAFEGIGEEDALVIIDHPPTSEMLAVILEDDLREALPENVTDVTVTVNETRKLGASG